MVPTGTKILAKTDGCGVLVGGMWVTGWLTATTSGSAEAGVGSGSVVGVAVGCGVAGTGVGCGVLV